MACPFPDGSGSAVPAQQPATDPTQRHKPDVRWSRPLMAWIYLGRRKQIRVLKDVPRCREEPRAQRCAAIPRKSRAQDRKLRPGDFAAYRPVCPVRLAYRVVREWGQDAPAERRTPPQSARCPRRAQAPFQGRTEENLFPLLAEYIAQRAHKSRNAAPLDCPPSVTLRTCGTSEPAEHPRLRTRGP
jgi:hypothetical protein